MTRADEIEGLVERLREGTEPTAELEFAAALAACPTTVRQMGAKLTVNGESYSSSWLLDPITGPGLWLALARERGWLLHVYSDGKAVVCCNTDPFDEIGWAEHPNPAIACACAIAYLPAVKEERDD